MINNMPWNRQDSHNNNRRLEGRKNQMRGISRFAKTQHTHRQIQRCTSENERPDDHYACHPRLQHDVATCGKQKQGDRSAFFSTGTNDERCSVVAQTCFTGPLATPTVIQKKWLLSIITVLVFDYHCVGLWLKQLPPKTSPPLPPSSMSPKRKCRTENRFVRNDVNVLSTQNWTQVRKVKKKKGWRPTPTILSTPEERKITH